jgi:hypothetical protein
MADIDLHEFKEDLKNKPWAGSDAPPRTIRASDLDGNFKKVMLIESDDIDPVPYEVEYTEDGTKLKNLKTAPDGVYYGDMLYWDPERGNNGTGGWRILFAPVDINAQDDRVWVLAFDPKFGPMWYRTEDCDTEE